MASCAVSSKRF